MKYHPIYPMYISHRNPIEIPIEIIHSFNLPMEMLISYIAIFSMAHRNNEFSHQNPHRTHDKSNYHDQYISPTIGVIINYHDIPIYITM